MYADDTQLYKSIDPSNFENQKQTAKQLHLCTSETLCCDRSVVLSSEGDVGDVYKTLRWSFWSDTLY